VIIKLTAKASDTFDHVKKMRNRYSKTFALLASTLHLTSTENTLELQLRGSEPTLFTFLKILKSHEIETVKD